MKYSGWLVWKVTGMYYCAKKTPWWLGLAWRYEDMDLLAYMPIPINFIVSWALDFYMFVRFPLPHGRRRLQETNNNLRQRVQRLHEKNLEQQRTIQLLRGYIDFMKGGDA